MFGSDRIDTIPMDMYYYPADRFPESLSVEFEGKKFKNFDTPEALETSLLVQHIEALKTGHEVQIPEYDFVHEYKVRQEIWVVKHHAAIDRLTNLFDQHVSCSYIADGHHRAAAAAIYAKEMHDQEGKLKSNDFNYMLGCLFPSNQLRIYDYNRIVKSLNGHSEKDFLKLVSEKFEVKEASRSPYDPSKPHRFGMYLYNKWYKLKALEGTYPEDAVGSLDVSILQNNLLDPILDIKDPRIDKRIDFIPGIKGMAALEKPVLKGKAPVAFSLFPITIEELFTISDLNEVMPPKSTWFEPKLMSGLVIFKMEL